MSVLTGFPKMVKVLNINTAINVKTGLIFMLLNISVFENQSEYMTYHHLVNFMCMEKMP